MFGYHCHHDLNLENDHFNHGDLCWNGEPSNIGNDPFYPYMKHTQEIEDIIVRRIKERILYLLGDMDRSESDIRQKLTGNGYTSTYIDSAIEQVKAYGYIDDRRYAISYAKSLIDGRHAGPALIRQKLYSKGISRDIIDSIETELQFDESEQIEAALLRKNFTKEDVVNSDYDTRRKLYGYLMRKGFSSSAISNFIHN